MARLIITNSLDVEIELEERGSDTDILVNAKVWATISGQKISSLDDQKVREWILKKFKEDEFNSPHFRPAYLLDISDWIVE